MSVFDYVSIVGHYNKIQSGPTIDPRILERGYDETTLAMMRAKIQKETSALTSLNIKFGRPIEEFEYTKLGYVLTLYRAYSKTGVLPFSGNLADQPAQIIEIFNTLESLDLEVQQRHNAEMDRKSKKERNRGRR